MLRRVLGVTGLVCAFAACLSAQEARSAPARPLRIALLGVGGATPGEASRVADALDSAFRAGLPADITLERTDSLAQYIRDYAHVDWRQLFALSDLVALARFRRLDGVLEVRVHSRGDSTTLDIQLADVAARDWTGVAITVRDASAFAALTRARAPVDSLLRAWHRTHPARAR